MSQPSLFCYQCHGRHTAKAKHFVAEVYRKEPVEQPDGTYLILKRTIGWICKKCQWKKQVEQAKPEIRKLNKLEEGAVVTRDLIRNYFQNRMKKAIGGKDEKE